MSELPKGWVKVNFDDAVEIVSDRGFRIKQKDYSPSGKLPVVDQGEGLIGGYTNELDAQVNAQLPVIVFGDHTRRFKFVKFPFAVGADGVKLLAPLPIWNPDFLFFQLRIIDLENRGYGRHFQHLRKESLKLAPASEQTRIVAKLEELLSDLDAGVAELKAAQKKLAQYRQSLLKAAVEGALTAEWRAHNTPAETGAQLLERILTERRTRWEAKQLAKFAEQGKTPPKDWQKKYPEPVQPDTTDLPELPEGWVWASLDMLTEKIVDGTHHTPIYTTSGVPFISVKDIRDGIIYFDDCKFVSDETHAELIKRCNPQKGDLLVTKSGTIGRTAIVIDGKEFSLFVSVALLKPSSKHVDMPWVDIAFQAWLQSINIANDIKGTAVKNLHLEDFRELHIPIPPIAEKSEAMSAFMSAWGVGLQLQQAIDASLKQTAAQRQNILRAAFAGELVPQDPNDEPASVLLERIRAERAERTKQPKKRQPKKQKEIATVVSKLIDVLAEAGDWLEAQEAFRRCGVADGALTERIEELYAELRKLDKAGRLAVESIKDKKGRKTGDRIKLLAG